MTGCPQSLILLVSRRTERHILLAATDCFTSGNFSMRFAYIGPRPKAASREASEWGRPAAPITGTLYSLLGIDCAFCCLSGLAYPASFSSMPFPGSAQSCLIYFKQLATSYINDFCSLFSPTLYFYFRTNLYAKRWALHFHVLSSNLSIVFLLSLLLFVFIFFSIRKLSVRAYVSIERCSLCLVNEANTRLSRLNSICWNIWWQVDSNLKGLEKLAG